MAGLKTRQLDAGYSWEVDTIDERAWSEALQEFEDANIYQTWSYGAVISQRRNTSHVVLRKDGEIVAIAQARLARLPILAAGIAYVQWGPLWRRNGSDECGDVFRQAIRALRNEFVCKRGLTLRLVPSLFDEESPHFLTLLSEEGFTLVESEARSRTILMDLGPPLEHIREGMRAHWKRELKAAERSGLEVIEGTGDELFETFIKIYHEMVQRKRFVEPNDIGQFRQIQAQLPDRLKMRIMLCSAGGHIAAGAIYSAVGKTAVYLFGATSNAGIKSRGSYILQWKLIEELKRMGVSVYDLNGINPTENPGTYKFKNDLSGNNGRDVYFLGRFDARGSLISWLCVQCWSVLRWSRRWFKKGGRSGWIAERWLKRAG